LLIGHVGHKNCSDAENGEQKFATVDGESFLSSERERDRRTVRDADVEKSGRRELWVGWGRFEGETQERTTMTSTCTGRCSGLVATDLWCLFLLQTTTHHIAHVVLAVAATA
jgi:hypothetical protein